MERIGNNPRRENLLVIGLIGLLAAVVLVQFAPSSRATVLKPNLPLADYLPTAMAGWQGVDKPLAETEALAGTVKSILNYDDTILRVYKRGGEEFTVYVAYWKPGKMPAREVAFHIPDKCWTAAGMTRTAANYCYQQEFDRKPLAPAQYREFDAGGARQNVFYWHIFDGHTIIYNPDGSPSNLSMLTDLWRRGLKQRGEQFFIRISSPHEFDALWRDPGFLEIIELLAPLGPGLSSAVEHS
jgi:hypothetical protein